jgi:hypothetical protein
MSWAKEMFGPTLWVKESADAAPTAKPTEEALAGKKFVGVYFSAHVSEAESGRSRTRAGLLFCQLALRSCSSFHLGPVRSCPFWCVQWCGKSTVLSGELPSDHGLPCHSSRAAQDFPVLLRDVQDRAASSRRSCQ